MKEQSKLLLFDLDDTLLNSNKLVSQENVSAIMKCKSKGMTIGYITARSPRKVKTFLKDLPCDCLAYYNGAKIFSGDNLLEKYEIPNTDGIKTMTEIQRAYPDVLIGVYLEPYSYFKGEIRNINTKETSFSSIHKLPNFDIQRIRIITKLYENISLSSFITDDMICLYSVHGSAVITNKNANKGNALRKFSKHFNISIKDIVAFGDDTNDIDMIKSAGIGVAMGNATEEVKAVANYVCDTNNNNGVAKWINKYLL